MPQNKLPLILDTDIGSDIDDAVALAYLLAQQRCELLGITTVSGDTQARASLASVLCNLAGRPDIPIYAGLSQVLFEGPGQPSVPQAEVLPRYPHRRHFSTQALDFLRESIRKRPGEITLLSIGPLSNLGALFAYDPGLPRLLKGLVMMAGIFRSPGREWNVLVDPAASALVYKAPLPRLVSVGLDVTLRCQMPAAEVRRRFSTPVLKAVVDMAEVWFRHSPRLCFHDPLAAALIFEPSLCKLSRGWIGVDIHDGERSGATPFLDDKKGPHEIADHVRVNDFFRHYFLVAGRS